MGHGQFALEGLIAQCRFVQLCVFHGKRRLAGHAGQYVQVFPIETVPRIQGIDLDYAQALPSPVISARTSSSGMRKSTMLSDISKRSSEAASADRTACFEAITLLMIVRLILTLCVSSERLYLIALGHQPAGLRVQEHDKSPVGLDENLEKAVQNLGSTSTSPIARPGSG